MKQDHLADSEITYNSYLQLDSILDAQSPLTSAHDETLFIIQHQTSELWMKLVIHELYLARKNLKESRLDSVNKILGRVARIFEQLNNAWDVLRTLTPSEYTEFRGHLGTASGFQSFQYRLIEYMLGNRDLSVLAMHKTIPEHYETLDEELQTPSIYDYAVKTLFQTLNGAEADVPAFQLRQPRVHLDEIQKIWQVVYDNSSKYWDLYELAEKLVDLEDYIRRWRFNHVTTVERIIGFKTGTGGSSGVPFLKQRLDIVLFPELWQVRGAL